MGTPAVSSDSILPHLQRVLASTLFQSAGRSRALLKFIIEEYVGGRIDRLKEYTIGAEALGRGDSFDPRTDPIVRAEASRLRGRLERYYATEGQADPVVIVLSKGSYVPQFRDRAPSPVGTLSPAPVPARARTRRLLWIATGAFIAISALVIVAWGPQHWKHLSGRRLIQFDVELRSSGVLGSEVGTDVVLSPDGTRLVFVTLGSDGVTRLKTRRLDQSEVTELPGTEGARVPFFSHDGEWVAFEAAGKLKKTPVEGGAPVVLCDATNLLGGSWGEDSNIIVSMGWGKLWRLPASGGTPTAVLDLTGEHAFPAWPQLLPKGNAILFTNIGYGGPNRATIEALSLSTGKRTVLAKGGTYGRYLPNGYLAYVNQGTLFAVPFDLDHLQGRGAATPVLDHISYSATFGYAQLDFSRTGTFVFRKDAGGQVIAELQDREGKKEPLLRETGNYVWPRLSPDGQRLAFSVIESGVPSVWIYDRQTHRTLRLTTPAAMCLPLWTRDGHYLILGTQGGLFWIRADGTGKPEALLQSSTVQAPWSLSSDGSRLAYHEMNPATGFDLWTVPIKVSDTGVSAGKPEPFLRTPAFETYPAFSPDGKWVAYGSNESGSWEVYVRAFPEGDKEVQISTDGGRIPFWSPNGHELLYRTDDQRVIVATYTTRGRSLAVQVLKPWSPSRLADTGVLANLDLTPDGQRFVMLTTAMTPETQNHVTFMLNFLDEVQRRVPGEGQ
jgi:Tol biopolymer transport system component